MEYSITFYGYKLEENELSISISKKDGVYLLTKEYCTYSLDSCFPSYTENAQFIYYIPMLHHLMGTFHEFYTEHVTHMYASVVELPPTYYITDIYDLTIDRYIEMANAAKIKMDNSILLYSDIIENIKSLLDKALFRLLLVKIREENINSLHTLCIAGDIIVQFL